MKSTGDQPINPTHWKVDRFILPVFDEETEFKANVLVTGSRELEEDGTEIADHRSFKLEFIGNPGYNNHKYLSKLWDAKIQKDLEDDESAAEERRFTDLHAEGRL